VHGVLDEARREHQVRGDPHDESASDRRIHDAAGVTRGDELGDRGRRRAARGDRLGNALEVRTALVQRRRVPGLTEGGALAHERSLLDERRKDRVGGRPR
jgi:hypothetical protein